MLNITFVSVTVADEAGEIMKRFFTVMSLAVLAGAMLLGNSASGLTFFWPAEQSVSDAEAAMVLPAAFSRDGCGADDPPSGPYLNYNLMVIMDYDCTTGTLTPGQAVSNTCQKLFVGSDVVPYSGFCAIANSGSSSSNILHWSFIARTGNFDEVYGEAHGHGGYGEFCEGTKSPQHNALVTFGSWRTSCGMSGGCSYQAFYAHGVASGPSGLASAQHNSVTYAC